MLCFAFGGDFRDYMVSVEHLDLFCEWYISPPNSCIHTHVRHCLCSSYFLVFVLLRDSSLLTHRFEKCVNHFVFMLAR